MGLFHITSNTAWAQAAAHGEYRAPSLELEGFIHLSFDRQWLIAGNRFFRGQRELVLLSIRADKLTSEVRLADADGAQYPHLFGPLNLDAVVEACAIPLEAGGVLGVPPELAPWRAMFLPAAFRVATPPALEAAVRQVEPGVAQVALCFIPEGGALSACICVERSPAATGTVGLSRLRAEVKDTDALAAHSRWLELPNFPRDAHGVVDEAALLARVTSLARE